MRKALEQALLAYEANEVPVGAVVVCNGKIIGQGHNMTERLRDVTAHAEIIAISAACEKLKSKYLNTATLYVTLEPCFMCAGALHWVHIERIVFGAADEKRGFLKYTPSVLHPKTELIHGVLAEYSQSLLKSFFKGLRA